jgi:serine/threonine protein kinase
MGLERPETAHDRKVLIVRAKGTIGYYRLESVIGDGGMGTVYRATDTRFDRVVAIKVLHPHFARDPEVRARFEAEARIQAQLNHPNIVSVYDFIVEEQQLCMVMEFIEGRSLDEVIAEETGPMPAPRCVEIMHQVLNAVGYAHGKGVVHRDLKPSNVMIRQLGDQSIAKVMDFGVAKLLGSEKLRTATGAKIGTLWYMSPEQLRAARNVDERSDIYSLGVTLYQMATGRVPFDADTEYTLMEAIVRQDPPRPSMFYPGVPPSFEAVILKAISKEPDGRFRTCNEFWDALERAGRWPTHKEVALSPLPPVTIPQAGSDPLRSPMDPGASRPPADPTPARAQAGPTPRRSGSPAETVAEFGPAPRARTEVDARPGPEPRQEPRKSSNRAWIWIVAAVVVVGSVVTFSIQASSRHREVEARQLEERIREERLRDQEQAAEAARSRARENVPPPQPAAAPSSQETSQRDRQAILQVIETWRTTVISNDIPSHMQCYAPIVDRYFGWTNASNARIESDKQKTCLRCVRFEDYTVSNVSFDAIGDDRARVSLRKSWDCVRPDGSHYRGYERQQLAFRKIDGRWRITSETESDVVKLP